MGLIVSLLTVVLSFTSCMVEEIAYDEEIGSYMNKISGTWKLESVDGVNPCYFWENVTDPSFDERDHYCQIKKTDKTLWDAATDINYITSKSHLYIIDVIKKYDDDGTRLDDQKKFVVSTDIYYFLNNFSWDMEYREKNIFHGSELDKSFATYEDGIELGKHEYILDMTNNLGTDGLNEFVGFDLSSEGKLIVTVYSNKNLRGDSINSYDINESKKINHKTVITYNRFAGEIPLYTKPVTPPSSGGGNSGNTGNTGSSESVDVKGTWYFGTKGSFTFKADGTYTYSGESDSMPGGTYSVNGSVLTMNFTNVVPVTEDFDVTISGNSMTLKSHAQGVSTVFSGYFKEVTLELTLTK